MIQFEATEPAPIPGAGPTNREGRVITVPFIATATDVTLLGGDAILMGWSIRESTRVNVAAGELYDGGSATGSFLACIDVNRWADLLASQTPASATASGANAAQAATITPAAGVTAFIQSLRIEGLGATAATEVTATLTGVAGGTISYPVSVPAGVAVPITPIEDSFPGRGLAGSAAGQAITLNLPAFGAGNTLETAEIQGYLQAAVDLVDTKWFGEGGIYLQTGLFLHVTQGSLRGAIWIRQ